MRRPKKSPKSSPPKSDLGEIAFYGANPGTTTRFEKFPPAIQAIWRRIAAAILGAEKAGMSLGSMAEVAFDAGFPKTDLVFRGLDPVNRAIWDGAVAAVVAAVRKKDAAVVPIRRKAA